ncbi:hypothetical protein B0187_04225 [Haemophilus paracuniculus]|uniref:Competence protein C n=1 Tax=Haemophilus paracuniculus TaxID=734 RepID=A0A1T0ATZ4_9PAST|nr:hypothetical protein [Haemophilus paracuniculus]OOS00157.1 hypothetical protein B0187_04225 [Haemophilus paracuniculus]
MKKWLQSFYLQPHHPLHLSLDFIQKWRWGIMLIITLLIVSYPLFRSIQLQQEWRNKQQEMVKLNDEISQQQKLLATLQARQINVSDKQITQINQTLEQLLAKHQMQLETQQWNLTEEKSVNLVANQRFLPLLELLKGLNQSPLFSFKSITLTKLNQDRLIQLNTDLMVTPQ